MGIFSGLTPQNTQDGRRREHTCHVSISFSGDLKPQNILLKEVPGEKYGVICKIAGASRTVGPMIALPSPLRPVEPCLATRPLAAFPRTGAHRCAALPVPPFRVRRSVPTPKP